MSADTTDRAAAPGAQPYCLVDAAALPVTSGIATATRRYAPLFDGRRSFEARLQAAREQFGDIVAWELQEAAIDLALAGILEPGVREPLPAPAQLERDPWGQAAHPERHDIMPLPTLLPGTLAQPGLPGAIAGSFGGRHRGTADEVQLPLSPGFFAGLARLFSAPAAHTWLGWLTLVLVIGGIVAMWNVRLDVAMVGMQLRIWYHFAIVLAVSALLNNLAAQLARLGAIRRATGEWPEFGLVFGFGFIPRFFTNTAGAAERADERGRSLILLSPLLGLLLLCLLAQFGWFLTRLGPGVLPHYFLGQAAFALLLFLFTVNPLARRDGYHWLSNRLGVPDLREQAWMSLFGWDRPWNERPLPSKRIRVIYAGAMLVYFAAVIILYLMFPARLLERIFGGAGVFIFVAVFGFSMYRQSRRGLYLRDSMEPFSVKLLSVLKYPGTWSKTTWIIIGIVALLFFVPYPYEPSGAAVVLPRDRAEVRALVSGDVKQVLVQEGDVVQAGQELLQISDVQTQAEVAAAEATLRRAQAELSIVKTGGASGEVQLAREKLETARKRQQFAQAEADRLAKAYSRKAVSPQEYDTARGTAAVRSQEVIEAQQQVKVIVNPARDERVAALQAEVLKAETELTYHKEQLANTHVRAPIAGRVVSDRLLFAKGTYLPVGAPIAFVEDTAQLQAEIELPESTMAKVHLDSRAWVRVWAFPGASFQGKVTHIAPDAEKGDYGKIVRVRVLLDDSNSQLKPEMTGQGKVRSHWTLAGLAFTRALVRFAMVEVWSWLP
ncbi:MAG: HlyD family efflux transporter periplasmic adaptor subunit [Hydrocarboniphaga sp.]|uniref:HlyD family secretion protein n=1 Tax=Hydrocarboniphaga sp. TaxID=2033016 RepID=UPI00261251E4|nr:efflux RND transporter periplasmic adaptor subunit [Hydrocarboniphaga sp.]MDB5969776.1 HlyD family efflux transporter periplasmic adaptor subunit [Hydrocarboniphaga sp.]